MDALIAGLASGALMASIFVTAGTFMAFAIFGILHRRSRCFWRGSLPGASC